MNVKVAVMRDGYVQMVYPFTLREGEIYLMFGDHGNFCHVQFEVPHEAI